jgi:hypothetical protein
MECPNVEERLSEYMERALPPEEMARVAEHLHACSKCASLLEDMRSVVLDCKAYPSLEPDLSLLERILLRTSGRPRTRTLRELIDQYFLRLMLTPRFAAGAALALLFLALSVTLARPHMSTVASFLSPVEMLHRLDRGVQGIYAEGLKAYDKKNEWQAQFTFFKNNVFHKLGFMIEQLDVPVQTNGKQKSGEPPQQQEKPPSQKSSLLLLRA